MATRKPLALIKWEKSNDFNLPMDYSYLIVMRRQLVSQEHEDIKYKLNKELRRSRYECASPKLPLN